VTTTPVVSTTVDETTTLTTQPETTTQGTADFMSIVSRK